MEEEWKDVEGWTGIYQVSNFGRAKRIAVNKNSIDMERKINRLIKPANANGYLGIRMHWGKTHKFTSMHRLVAITFLPNPQNFPEVNHLDGNKHNNNVDNLEWTTELLNKRHAVENGLTCWGERQGLSKLTIDKAIRIRELALTGEYTLGELASMYDMSASAIHHLLVGYTWKQLCGEKIFLTRKRKTNRKPTTLTFEQACEVRNLYKTGKYTQASLARKYSCDKSFIWKVVTNRTWKTAKYQSILDSIGIGRKGTTAKFTNADIKEMIRLREKEKLTYAEIAKRFPATRCTISKLIRNGYKLGIKGEIYDRV